MCGGRFCACLTLVLIKEVMCNGLRRGKAVPDKPAHSQKEMKEMSRDG